MHTDKKINILIIITGIVVVTLSVLKISGVLDLSQKTEGIDTNTSKLELVDEWESKPFGGKEFDYPEVYIKMRLYDNGLLTHEVISQGDNFVSYGEAPIYIWYNCDLSKVTYNDLEVYTLGSHNADTTEFWKTMNYTGLILPCDCVNAKLNGDDIEIETVQLHNGDKEVTVKIIPYAYREDSKNLLFELTDKNGKIHTVDSDAKK